MLWQIPLSMVSNIYPDKTRAMFMVDSTMKVNVSSNMQWVKLNHNRAGYYKVSCPAKLCYKIRWIE